MPAERITITLPKEMAEDIRKAAAARRESVSKFVAQALIAARQMDLRSWMIEGYQEMAEENHRLAEESLAIAQETWPRD
ncbi:MAG: ribbon-helix-helix protein, CopG family [Chloroflexota bacterium]|nr:ribbon-helix-helix protein, CopG family [Chloroflexota bacterium]